MQYISLFATKDIQSYDDDDDVSSKIWTTSCSHSVGIQTVGGKIAYKLFQFNWSDAGQQMCTI